MVRRHGWQYPAHLYQVVAITVFFILATFFYTFLSPFLGHTLKQYVAIGIFSPVAFSVFFLYVRCTAIDPSDPGILTTDSPRGAIKQAKSLSTANCPKTGSRQGGLQSDKILNIDEGRKGATKKQHISLLGLSCMLELLVKGDKCRKEGIDHQSISDEDLLYCTLCNAEVYKISKHCRSCDKCVEGFDHHCRWLNNCIGRKNYVSFVSLMAACLVMLLFETFSGLMVLVRCFTDKGDIRIHLTDKLGNGFSMAPFSALVALCTLAPLLASIPLGELFFFHMLLIQKGITTYEYVIAMRTRNEPQAPAEVERQRIPLQQSGSNAASWRGSSSVGLPHHAAWCSPRRAEQQKGEAISRADKGKLPCTVDADSTTVIERTSYRSSRHAVKISALKLAMLNPKEAADAAIKARESSSVLRPIEFHSFKTSQMDCGSSCNTSTRSSMSLDHMPASARKGMGKEVGNSLQMALSPRQEMSKEERDVEILSGCSSNTSSAPLSPLPAERRLGNPNVNRTSVKHLQMGDLGDARRGLQVCNATILPKLSIEHPLWICTTPINDGHETSRGSESVELGKSHIISVDAHTNGENHSSSSSMAVYWDRAAGRFRSLPDRNHNRKVSNLQSKNAAPDLLGGGLSTPPGPYAVLSPRRYLVNANSASCHTALNISRPWNYGKENSLKWAGDSSKPFSIHNHIVLPSQSSNGLATFRCQPSTSACRTVQKSMPHEGVKRERVIWLQDGT